MACRSTGARLAASRKTPSLPWSEAKPKLPSAATATPKGALGTIPALDTNGWRVVIAVAEACSAGAVAAVVVQGGGE